MLTRYSELFPVAVCPGHDDLVPVRGGRRDERGFSPPERHDARFGTDRWRRLGRLRCACATPAGERDAERYSH